jgi:hypothetical protein
MSCFLKALVVVAAIVIALLIVAGVVGYFWWSKHGKEFAESGRQARVEGEQFGEETDDQGCLDEALTRHKRAGGFTQTLAHRLFLGGCLSASEPTAGFCEHVPKRKDVVKSGVWQAKRCTEAGFSDPYCRQLFGQMQEYCESGLAELPGENSRASPRAKASPAQHR